MWTDTTVGETVTSAYLHSHLRTNEQQLLSGPVYFGGDLTESTYLDWILNRCKRLFLILVATGVPDQIFGVVDDSFDDEDLPIAAERVPDLRLSYDPDHALDRRFYKTQFRFLTRVLEDGEHIRYAAEEEVPITPIGIKSVITLNKDGIDTVRLPSDSAKIYLRRRVKLSSHFTEESLLAEVAYMKAYAHSHVQSVFASCLQGDIFTILSLPAPEYTLRAFLMDTPKSFDTLSKSQRRQTMMNWPHCLANALAWLHANGGHHGAIRPSNIHIDQHYAISLGPLDGGGVLCTQAKSDDIETYQYAPPERWKRAVTVQSTGSGKMSLPSGGRSARKASEPPDPADPSTRKRSGSSAGMASTDGLTTYAYLPASKSEYTRFRLSTAVNSEALVVPPPRRSRNAVPEVNSNSSRSTTRATNDRSTPARAPSALSQTSSEGKRRSTRPRGIFVAAPESRTAVVQTWRSVQHDSFAADVFSLGAVILDILTVLCKRTYSSFARHRSAKNRTAGRGGGLADASFHANLGQVMTWAEQLSVEAQKKIKKDESQVLSAVGPVIQVLVQCLERNPDARLKSAVLEQRLQDHIKRFANMEELHCISTARPERTPTAPGQQAGPEEPSPLMSPIQMRSDRSASRSRQNTIEEEPPSAYSPSTRPTTSRTMVSPYSPPSVSLTSLPSLNFNMDDGRSDTVVGGHEQSREPSLHQRSRRRREASTRDVQTHGHIEAWTVPEVSTPKRDRMGYIHGNESAVDPQLTVSTNASERGAFTFMNYSTSPSSEDGDEPETYRYPLPPRPPAPTKDLPPPPPLKKVPASAQRHRYLKSPPPEPTRDEVAMLRQLSRTAIGGHPPRKSSLVPGQSDADDEDIYREKARARKPAAAALPKTSGDRRERVYRTYT